ncbi:ribose 5-phosphate isomerase B [Saccharicrinis fermentans]|uniref:Ribose-5-phosphate isomerase B n=1 Tax=Saccharicrinis fermentans DSM 9555 = JCM 21142 TaxID=869213 RepID=W7Y1F6_9BACT|nr:ribose 5-phosphate isomerase B [Saccharicrinis fermentans]GAF01802.1 ribose-5-phosphate isomerase B [Saccharicrinis fermentans DSM 9555 = JCM 21142]
MKYTTIGLAADHAGYELKETLKSFLSEKGIKCIDFGTDSKESCDYADFAHPLATAVENKDVELGISVCGSGNGINMTVNKHVGIRAALCWNKEISELARVHNDANICSLPARFISSDEAKAIIDAFLESEFEGGRHQRRIEKIPC